ncbi:MAG: CRISPR-associated endonuclease Cas2 [Chitinophagales bacterium]|nr:CRISPR-associated endonuclease Cas2 [Chitinophagales bacterium]MDW8420010.1 CRISPR-associated endonuclease Cas2 [Chitinophagales bacterium]
MAQLICYDIEDHRKREKLAKELTRMGFVRIQLSVFAGNLRHAACMALLEKIRSKWKSHSPSDKFYMFFIDDHQMENCYALGQAPDWELILQKAKYRIF